MPIQGLSEQKRLPRIGKIHLGVKKVSPRTGKEYPVATPYFVCPPEVVAVYGDKPTRLDVIIPVDDEELFASQYYRQYSRTRGLVCKGDGITCRRMLDISTGNVAGKDTKDIAWRENLPCAGKECPDYKAKACQEVMNLQVMLPKVPGLGIWQIDTGSVHSIMNVNNSALMIRAMCGTVAWIPLVLSLDPTEVNNPDDGKKKTVRCMSLRYEGTATALLADSSKTHLQLLMPKPVDDEAPDDRLLTTSTPEKAEELNAKVTDDIAELWGGEPVTKARPVKSMEQETTAEAFDKLESAGTKPAAPPAPPASPAPGSKAEGQGASPIDLDWLKETLKAIDWKDATAQSWIKAQLKVTPGASLEDTVRALTPEQAKIFSDHVRLMRESAGK